MTTLGCSALTVTSLFLFFVLANLGVRAQEVPHNLREFASPAKLWLEGFVWKSTDGVTSRPRRFRCAAFDPYYVDGEETVTVHSGTAAWFFEVHLPDVSGELWLPADRKSSDTSAILAGVRPLATEPNLWRHPIRHFLDPRMNSPDVLARRAHFELWSTATIAVLNLRTGPRTFFYDASGILREKRAGGRRHDGTTLQGVLRFEHIADAPFFPRTIVHERADTATSQVEVTRWEFTHLEEVSSPEQLRKLVRVP